MLEDFLTGTASMARKRHLASTARGFFMFLSCSQYPQADLSNSSYPWWEKKKRIPPGDADGHLPGGMIMVWGLNSVSRFRTDSIGFAVHHS